MLQNNRFSEELAENFIQKHFGSPVVRLPFHMNYIGKIKLGEMLFTELIEEAIYFLNTEEFSVYKNPFREEILKIALLNGNRFILFRTDKRKLYLDILPQKRSR